MKLKQQNEFMQSRFTHQNFSLKSLTVLVFDCFVEPTMFPRNGQSLIMILGPVLWMFEFALLSLYI